MKNFKVVPICDKQRRDIKKENILEDGLYRTCDVYKGGGGYDKFPEICNKRLGYNYSHQFVVQLFGCPLKCPYCYVTREGIFGEYRNISSKRILESFKKSNQDIFHLMGGAPALYLEDWSLIIDELDKNKIFHSDLLLVEKEYSNGILRKINKNNTLYAVSIKGFGDDYEENTGVEFNEILFWKNLNKVIENKLNFYFTYTNMSDENIQEFKNMCKENLNHYNISIFENEFKIDLVLYEALK